mmetsp:Transcript_33577/g.52474  ORF Transcript_33577/g.52474 Transcript_33577/m.52474 type:complete len:262 (-) Transcript_33577:38-823(-)
MNQRQSVSKLVQVLSRISLFGVNTIEYITLQQCETSEQLLLLCGIKLFLEYNMNLFYVHGHVDLCTLNKLVDAYSELPMEVRFVLEQQGCRIFLKMVAHDDLISELSAAKSLYFIEDFGREFKARMKGKSLNHSYDTIFSFSWDKLTQKRQSCYLTIAELLLKDEREFRKECSLNRIFGCIDKAFTHYSRYNPDMRKVDRTKSPAELHEFFVRSWKASADKIRLYHLERIFKEPLVNMFLQKVTNKYELRSRVKEPAHVDV